MNHIEKITGKKIPFVWEDFDFLQAGIKEVITGMMSKFGISADKSFKISGCEASYDGASDAWSVTAGYFCLEGEICYVAAHTTPVAGGTVRWGIDETNDANGQKEDSEGGVHDTYKIRRAKLESGVAPPLYAPPNCETLEDRLNSIVSRDMVNKADTDKPFVYLTSDKYKNGWQLPSAVLAMRYRIDQLGYLELKGNIDPSGATAGGALQLPAGGFNNTVINMIYGIAVSDAGALVAFVINETGLLTFLNYSIGANQYNIDLRVKIE